MATYLYNCRNCERFTEVTRAMKDTEVIPACPDCEQPMGRVYSSVPVQFKGTGFYKTGG